MYKKIVVCALTLSTLVFAGRDPSLEQCRLLAEREQLPQKYSGPLNLIFALDTPLVAKLQEYGQEVRLLSNRPIDEFKNKTEIREFEQKINAHHLDLHSFFVNYGFVSLGSIDNGHKSFILACRHIPDLILKLPSCACPEHESNCERILFTDELKKYSQKNKLACKFISKWTYSIPLGSLLEKGIIVVAKRVRSAVLDRHISGSSIRREIIANNALSRTLMHLVAPKPCGIGYPDPRFKFNFILVKDDTDGTESILLIDTERLDGLGEEKRIEHVIKCLGKTLIQELYNFIIEWGEKQKAQEPQGAYHINNYPDIMTALMYLLFNLN